MGAACAPHLPISIFSVKFDAMTQHDVRGQAAIRSRSRLAGAGLEKRSTPSSSLA
jgi:hypothetical protein